MVMKIKTFGYCVEQGVINLYKNRLMTLASIGTISACILIIGIFYSIISNVDFMVNEIQNNIGVSVFFEDGITQERIDELKTIIGQREEVYSITYISAEEAWEGFKADYFKGREQLLAGFENENPLKDSASLQVFLNDISKQASLVTYLDTLPDVSHIREDRQVTNVIKSISDLIKYFSIALVAILIIISVFLISNTVRLTIELRKREINIMKYVGATDTFIRGPFVIEGAVIGLVGSIIPLGIIFYFYTDIISRILQKYILLDDYLLFMPVSAIFVRLVPLSILIGAGIGVVGSMMTIHKHLKV
ncbi:MAG: ABC transporter permease [Firmicutes bacterium HGW-Firmicutes-1]|jgi:cell division transport system permease protein|nr:MAG: ABC transporter permease [Firmicutes bacterium HGW-Firmicutes-1]